MAMAMGETEERNKSSGIKLFGTTISVKEISEAKNDDEESRKDDAEKIVRCPRCKSMETKFCYFNNYNVNQPRHFCRGCQRYWTAGGALRNVPIGAGRRKAKPPQHLGVEGWQVERLCPAKRRRCDSQ